MKKITAMLFLALGASLQAGCELTKSCTEATCTDQMSFTLLGAADAYAGQLPVLIDACADSNCGVYSLFEEGGVLKCSAPGDSQCSITSNGDLKFDLNVSLDDTVTAKITVTNEAGDTLLDDSFAAETKEFFPNGSNCEPVCLVGKVEFSAGTEGA